MRYITKLDLESSNSSSVQGGGQAARITVRDRAPLANQCNIPEDGYQGREKQREKAHQQGSLKILYTSLVSAIASLYGPTTFYGQLVNQVIL